MGVATDRNAIDGVATARPLRGRGCEGGAVGDNAPSERHQMPQLTTRGILLDCISTPNQASRVLGELHGSLVWKHTYYQRYFFPRPDQHKRRQAVRDAGAEKETQGYGTYCAMREYVQKGA